jgi:diguanylate cyclase (GGDEF)-like protein
MSQPTSILSEVEILQDLNKDEMAVVGEYVTSVDVGPQQVVFHEGDPGFELYIVESGMLEATVGTEDGGEFPVAHFRSGDFFGEMSIFEDAPRSATCRTEVASKLLVFSKSDFFALVDHHPRTAIKIMDAMLRVISGRLRATNSLVSEMVQWGEDARRRVAIDPLTGLFNRRFLDGALPGLFSRAVSGAQPLSIVMLDLDHFRDINDSYGHDAGDAVIKSIAPTLREVYGTEESVLARYGGDEFTFALPGVDVDRAYELALEAGRRVGALRLQPVEGVELVVTLSQGVAGYPQHAGTLEDLVRRADNALYAAKENGRNRAEIAAQPPE